MPRASLPHAEPRRPIGLIAAGFVGLLIVAVAAWLFARPSPPPAPPAQVASVPAPSVRPVPAATPTPAPAQAVLAPRFVLRAAAEAEIARNVPAAMTVFRFLPNPRILVIDFPDLQQQGLMLNRIAALVEKQGLPRDHVLTDGELDAAIAAHGDTMATYYYGHDYAAADVARFFVLADAQHLKLRPEEENFRALLAQEGLLVPGAVGAVISVPRAGSGDGIDQGMREGILHHELSHGEYFSNAAYADYTRRFWRETLDDTARDAFRRYLGSQDYDTALADLMSNEMQAYLMHTPDPRLFSAQVLGMEPARFAQFQAAFLTGMPGGWLRDCTPVGIGAAASASTSRPRRRGIKRRRAA